MRIRTSLIAVIVAAAALVPAVPAQAAKPVINIKGAVTAVESGGQAKILVTLNAPSTHTVTVAYDTSSGGPTPATPGDDYASKSGTLTFKPGKVKARISVALSDDALDENDETFLVSLGAATGAKVNKFESTVTITDDDVTPDLTIGDASIMENAPSPLRPGTRSLGPTTFVGLTVTLSAPSGRTVSLAYSTHDGTALSGNDYQAAPFGTLDIPAGSTSGGFYIGIYDDATLEGDETFTVTVDDATATVTDGSATVTILDDESCVVRPSVGPRIGAC